MANDNRIDKLLDILSKYTFPDKIPVNSAGDNIDAITTAVNTLIDKLDAATEAEKKAKEDLRNFTPKGAIASKYHETGQHEKELYLSETTLQHTIDNMLEGIQIISHDWRYLYVNDALLKQAKYSREELIGKTLMEKYPGIELTDAFKVFIQCMENRVPYHIENEFTFPDRTQGWFELSIQPIPEGIFILSVDITGRKKAQIELEYLNKNLEQRVKERTQQLADINELLESKNTRLKESEEKFSKIFEASPVGISIGALPAGTIIDANRSFLQMFGYTHHEVIGRTSYELNMIDNTTREIMRQELIDKGKIRDKEVVVRKKNGVELPLLLSLDHFKMRGEQYAITISYDISNRKKAEEQIKQLNIDLGKNLAQLEIANKELEAFSYSISHDLRAPLRAINGYARMFEDRHKSILDNEGIRMLGRIQNNSKRMGDLIDDLLAFSKLGKKGIQKTLVNINDLTASIVLDFNKTLKHNASIKINDLHPAFADKSLIGQVIINLLSNAIKYSSKAAKPVIEMSSWVDDEKIIYSVKDNGVGFDMQYVSKLFKVFNRLHSSEEFEGTGVGLAIVSRIVNKHGGTVWVDAKPGEGATFFFSLPIDIH